MSLLLSNQRILITGSGRGIGRAMAILCAQEGAKVALLSRTLSEIRETSTLLPPNSQYLTLSCDIRNENDVQSAVKAMVDQWGGIDVLINNAGGAQPAKGPSWELSSQDLSHLLELNVVAVHRVTKHVLTHAMLPQKAGRIINVSSKAGKMGLPDMSHYVTSKFALEGLTASLASELNSFGIRVNSISPGMVNTRSFPKAPGKAGVRSPESVKDGLMLLLQSDVTGHYLHVDELDQVRARGLPDSAALKSIDEPKFDL